MATTGVDTATLITRLIALTDLSRVDALARLSQRHKEMVAKALALRETLTVGTTTAFVFDYVIPAEVVEVMTVSVDGKPYDKVDHDTMDNLLAGYSWINYSPYSSNAVFTDAYTGVGAGEVSLYPAPTATGLAITARAAVLPPDLVDNGANFPSLPADFHEDLIDAAWATVLRQDESRFDMWQSLEQRFESRIAELRRRLGDRIGSGPVQIRLVR